MTENHFKLWRAQREEHELLERILLYPSARRGFQKDLGRSGPATL